MSEAKSTGRIDVHAHILSGVDDGCASVDESIACARLLVRAGYQTAFCTPHVWPSLPGNNVREIPRRVVELQGQLDRAGVPLKLLPGGELNLRPDTLELRGSEIVSYGMAGRFCIFDIWADRMPDFFEPAVKYLQSFGLTVVMAHPERVRFVQEDPDVVDQLQEMGLLLQGNLQCFSDPEHVATRITAERFLRQGRYFMLGSDTHNPRTLPCRLDGLLRTIELAGPREVERLTVVNPARIVAASQILIPEI